MVPRVDEVVPDRTVVEERGGADVDGTEVDVTVGCWVDDDDDDVDCFGAVVVATGRVELVLVISLTVVAGDEFDTPGLGAVAGRTRM